MRWLAAINALALLLKYIGIYRDASDSCLSFLLNLGLSLFCSVPVAKKKTSLLYLSLKFIPSIHLINFTLSISQRFIVNILLDFIHKIFNSLYHTFRRHALLCKSVSARDLYGAVLQIPRTYRDPYRNT